MKYFPNSTFLKSLDWVHMDEISSRLLASSNFHELLCKDRSALISSTSRFELWQNQNQHLIWSSLAALCGVVLSPPQHHLGHPLHVHHLLFRTPLLGAGWDQELLPSRRKGTQQSGMGETSGVWSQMQCRWGDKPSKPEYQKPFLVHLLEWIYVWCRTE